LLPDNVKFQLGSVLLREEEAGPTHSMILEHAVSTFLCLQNKISELQRVNLQLAQEQQTALERLEHAIRSKEQVEKEMYSKFKLVLNEKKNKIRRLMDGLVTSAAATALEDEVATTSPAGHSSTPPPPPQSTLLGVPELVSPPTKRRKREARCTETKEPDIPKPPNISCPQTKETNRSKKSDSQQSSSADEDDLLGLL
jgi:DNA-repair protein XRCC4